MTAYNVGHGYHAVIERRRSGVGPTILVGELRDSQDRFVTGRTHADNPSGVGKLLTALTAHAHQAAGAA
jgi:hypothetical protein